MKGQAGAMSVASGISTNSKIFFVSERLAENHQEQPEEDEARLALSEERVSKMEEELEKFTSTLDSNLATIRTEIELLRQRTSSERQEDRDRFLELQTKIFEADEKYSNELDSELREYKNNESVVFQEIDKAFSMFKRELDSDRRAEASIIEQCEQELARDLPQFTSAIQSESVVRGQSDSKIVQNFSEHFVALKLEIRDLNKDLPSKEKLIFEEVKSEITGLRTALTDEKNKREINEEILLALLENTLRKLESSGLVEA